MRGDRGGEGNAMANGGNNILTREVTDRIRDLEQAQTPEGCHQFTGAVREALKLSLRMGESALCGQRVVILLLLALLATATKVDGVGLLDLLF